MWIWTTRPGFAGDLAEELVGRRPEARGVALVASEGAPERWPTFARTGFELAAEVAPDAAAGAVVELLDRHPRKPWLLAAWVPDSDAQNRLAAAAARAGEAAIADVARRRPDLELRRLAKAGDAVRYGGLLVQLCLVAPDRLLVGAVAANDVPTLAPGGRARAPRPGDAPSRAARKLEEAFEWIGRAPEAGEVCVDLGAAPGGWTAVLLARRARVIAVDPAKLAENLRGKKGVAHVQASAFEFTPTEPVDWLFCDMAWRPMEVAALLAKWGRKKLAQTLVANLKLPMKQRALFAAKVREVVAAGGWQDVRTRQLYHDREEITLAAWRT
jgi:23S rRNA (cytidine2498-2'-O)-methyltransferase